MIKATIIERYIRKTPDSDKRLSEIVHDIRYFSTKENFHMWFDTFKAELWEDDPSKVQLAEGIYVKTEDIVLDNTEKPRKLKLYATFRKGISYCYAS